MDSNSWLLYVLLVALIIGGDIAASICEVIYKGIYPYLVYVTSLFVVFGLLIMYLRGETALSATKKKKKEPKREETAESNVNPNVNETVQVENKADTVTENNPLILETESVSEEERNKS